MARTQNTLIGRSSGSIGGVTLSTWKGINVAKAKAETVANPRTEGQINQRAKMAFLVALFQFISSVVKQGFKELAIGQSEFNAFTSANLKNGSVTAAGGVATFVPAELQISKGSMAQTPITGVGAVNATNDVEIIFSSELFNPSFSAGDKVIAAVYNAANEEWSYSIAEATRNAGTVTVNPQTALSTGNALKVYLGFYNSLTGKVSTSVYFAKAVTN